MAAKRHLSDKRPAARVTGAHAPEKEPWIEQIASFVGFFIYLLVLKSFFLPLFIIPTGSMAETLYGAHAIHTCPNCGIEYPIGLPPVGSRPRVPIVQCPNCRWQEHVGPLIERERLLAEGAGIDADVRHGFRRRTGDRIMVHGWPYDVGGMFGPQRWDVVVFKVPSDGQTNYIKRLIGKPGETIEIIDGDIFVTEPGGDEARIARKTAHAQRSLWFPYYDHDYPARRPSAGARYHPRWVALAENNGWTDLHTRRPRFDGLDGRRGEIQFVTAIGPTRDPGQVADIYGYDAPYGPQRDLATNAIRLVPAKTRIVTDVRLSCDVAFEDDGANGFVELGASKYVDQFFARVYADGRVTLEHAAADDAGRVLWGERRLATPDEPVRVALSNADYRVTVEIDGKAIIESTVEQYAVSARRARVRSRMQHPPRLTIAAQGVRAELAHLLIERDVYYTSDVTLDGDRAGYGTCGHAITLGGDEYFVLGDNSPASLDGRFSFAQQGQRPPAEPAGPQLKDAWQRGEYQLGTVPADQLIGPAFFVYWPATDALVPDRYLPAVARKLNHLPNPGRIRWIH